MRGRSYGLGIGVLAVLATVSACGGLPERRDGATAEATRFERALKAGEHGRLCAALAPATREELEQSARSRCERAIGRAIDERELPAAGAVRGADVYGDQARVT